MTSIGVAVARVALDALARPRLRVAAAPGWLDARPDVLAVGDALADVAVPEAAASSEALGSPADRRRMPGRLQPVTARDTGSGRRGDAAADREARRLRKASPGSATRGWAVPVPGPAGLGRGSAPAGSAGQAEPAQWMSGPAAASAPRPDPPVPGGEAVERATAAPAIERIAVLAQALLGRTGTTAGVPRLARLAAPQQSPMAAASASAAPSNAKIASHAAPRAAATADRRRRTGAASGLTEAIAAADMIGDNPSELARSRPEAGAWSRPARVLLDALAAPTSADTAGTANGRSAYHRVPSADLDADALADAVATALAEQARHHGVELS